MKALKNYSVKKGNKYEKETEGGGAVIIRIESF